MADVSKNRETPRIAKRYKTVMTKGNFRYSFFYILVLVEGCFCKINQCTKIVYKQAVHIK